MWCWPHAGSTSVRVTAGLLLGYLQTAPAGAQQHANIWPIPLMLMQGMRRSAYVIRKTRDLAQFTILADILVIAAGYPISFCRKWSRPGLR